MLRVDAGAIVGEDCYLRLDTDWYESTKVELEYMYSRLQSGGALIIDDYCAWQGSRTAVDEFFTNLMLV